MIRLEIRISYRCDVNCENTYVDNICNVCQDTSPCTPPPPPTPAPSESTVTDTNNCCGSENHMPLKMFSDMVGDRSTFR